MAAIRVLKILPWQKHAEAAFKIIQELIQNCQHVCNELKRPFFKHCHCFFKSPAALQLHCWFENI